jgi:hypothetical protein
MFFNVTMVASHKLLELLEKQTPNPALSEKQPSFRKLVQIADGFEMVRPGCWARRL